MRRNDDIDAQRAGFSLKIIEQVLYRVASSLSGPRTGRVGSAVDEHPSWTGGGRQGQQEAVAEANVVHAYDNLL
jgi:hypothetical protein